ncbi:MAG: Asp23/Gls24 family envelope stress response protein [Liquorilactobacillus satsumensis]|uniref:Asp23/Gls24 family envelope stress response protein n=1 Tax=Lactobacillaceae TaxID=33958 RepID=UPI001E2E0C60|nr:Asp23/Gls24 family envelope stress response protein [Leuconostoc pseudomesenteroides]MCC8439668.1 Asp23/Gls24 family envelope stress response protein [Leuconostoc pseudomesenteroides]
MVTENKSTQSASTNVKGELTFNDKVIQKIVGYAIENVKGLLGVDGGFVSNIKNKIVNNDDPTDGIDVEVGKEQVAVDLDVIMEFGHNAHDIYKELIKVTETQLEKTTSLKLVELNVQIIDIQTQAEYKNSRVTLQDKVSDAGNVIKEKTSDGVSSIKETASNLTDDSRVK